jgi:hypothetical protein
MQAARTLVGRVRSLVHVAAVLALPADRLILVAGKSIDENDFPAERRPYAMRDVTWLQRQADTHGESVGMFANLLRIVSNLEEMMSKKAFHS